jgi:hypothetical protein
VPETYARRWKLAASSQAEEEKKGIRRTHLDVQGRLELAACKELVGLDEGESI